MMPDSLRLFAQDPHKGGISWWVSWRLDVPMNDVEKGAHITLLIGGGSFPTTTVYGVHAIDCRVLLAPNRSQTGPIVLRTEAGFVPSLGLLQSMQIAGIITDLAVEKWPNGLRMALVAGGAVRTYERYD